MPKIPKRRQPKILVGNIALRIHAMNEGNVVDGNYKTDYGEKGRIANRYRINGMRLIVLEECPDATDDALALAYREALTAGDSILVASLPKEILEQLEDAQIAYLRIGKESFKTFLKGLPKYTSPGGKEKQASRPRGSAASRPSPSPRSSQGPRNGPERTGVGQNKGGRGKKGGKTRREEDTREEKFAFLVSKAGECRKCYGICKGVRCLSGRNGPLVSPVLFIGEAPGRAGAGKHGKPLGGVGASGENFKRMLKRVGKTRDDVFVTNCLLCSPTDEKGNRKPTEEELSNCLEFLTGVLDIISPQVVATMGHVALETIEQIEPHGLVLPRAVGKPVDWNGRILFPLYHPSPLAFKARNFREQAADIKALFKLVSTPTPLKGEGSGKFIQRLWMSGLNDPDRLVELVHQHWEGRKTTVRDVYYNYRRLLLAGQNPPPWRS